MRIEAADDYERSIRRLVRRWLRRVDRLTKRAGKGDVEAVHDMRTGIRRLRTLLSLASGKRARRLRKRAKALGLALGAVRDLDVVRESVELSVARGELFLDAGVQAWLDALDRERSETLVALRKSLRGSYCSWHRRTRAWTKGGKPGPRIEEELPRALGLFLGEAEALLAPSNEGELHELRKASKRLRYAFEFFEKVLPAETVEVSKRLTAVQDALGEHRDRIALAERADLEAEAVSATGGDARELLAYARRLRDASGRTDAVENAKQVLTLARITVADG